MDAIQPINTFALQTALSTLLGVQGADLVQKLYELLDNAEARGQAHGYAEGYVAGKESDEIADEIDAVERDAFANGWEYGNVFGQRLMITDQSGMRDAAELPCDVEYDFAPNGYIPTQGDVEFTERMPIR